MPWIAVDSLDDARDAATALLFPFDAGRWLRLALIAFFVGSGSAPGLQWNAGSTNVTPGGPGAGGGGPPFPGVTVSQNLLLLVAGVLAVALIVVVLLVAIGSVMEFVLVDALTSRVVRIRESFRRHLRPGLRLFVFSVGLFLLTIGFVGVPILLLIGGGVTGLPILAILAVPLLFLGILVAAVVWVVGLLTTDFVVPAMMAEEGKVLSAWRRVFPLVRREWKEVGLYLLLRFAIGFGAAVAVGLVTLLAALVVAVPFVVVLAVAYVALAGTGGPAAIGVGGGILLGAIVALYLLVMLVVSLLVQVPVVTFFRYYALFVLGSLDGALDLVTAFRDGPGDTPGRGSGPNPRDDTPDGPGADRGDAGAL